jgi:hypothetical protein
MTHRLAQDDFGIAWGKAISGPAYKLVGAHQNVAGAIGTQSAVLVVRNDRQGDG